MSPIGRGWLCGWLYAFGIIGYGLLGSRIAHAGWPTYVRTAPVEALAAPFFAHAHGAAFGSMCSACFVQTNELQLGGFVWEHKYVVLTARLFAYQEQRNIVDVGSVRARSFRIPRLDLLWRQGHVGLGTDGLVWGQDINKGISEQFQWNVYVTGMLVRTPVVRLDTRLGYSEEHAKINVFQTYAFRALEPSLWLQWNVKWFGGALSVKADIPTTWIGNLTSMEANVQLRARLAAWGPAQLALRLDGVYAYRPVYSAFNLAPHVGNIGLALEIRIHDFLPKSMSSP